MARAIEGWRRNDPPPVPQLAVPVAVPNHLYESTRTASIRDQAAGELSLIAFYYLLRVGEYTRARTSSRSSKRTINFQVRDVGFWKNGKILPRNSPLHVLLTADACTLKITNQKNGRMGETIHQQALTNNKSCPVRALAQRVYHILSHGGTTDTPICDFMNSKQQWDNVDPTFLIRKIRFTVKALNLADHGIDPDLVGIHSLRAGGAMAMRLNGADDTTIMKMGRWTSMTFMMYIHNQIAHLSNDLSNRMSTPIPFANIAAIEAAA